LFGIKEDVWKEKGGINTAREVYRQNDLWIETYNIIKEKEEEIRKFLDSLDENTKIIFTGAGTSAYVGNTATNYLNSKYDYDFGAIATTDIVSSPYLYLKEDVPTVFVSFARSGNSPESIATFDIGEEIVNDVKHIFITCNKDGKMEELSRENDNILLLLMPEETHDKGFAMTSSYTNMLLASILTFEINEIDERKKEVETMRNIGQDIIDNAYKALQEIVDLEYDRSVFLGSGSLTGLARESALKLLELTRGRSVTLYESTLGFRHGPKSILNDKTLVFIYVSNNPYTYKYDFDLVKEVYSNEGEHMVIVISEKHHEELEEFTDYHFSLSEEVDLDESYLASVYVIYAQIFALLSSVKLGIAPDNPSPDKMVNRVVEGVTLYPYSK